MILQTNSEITFKWLDAFNEHDIEKLLALYSDDADHYSPKLKVKHPDTKGIIKGKEALRNWWSDAFKQLPDLHYEIISMGVDKEYVMMKYKRTVTGEADMEVNEILHIKDGLIISSVVIENK